MLSIESIKNDFSYVKAWTGDTEVYQNAEEFSGHGSICDVYFQTSNRQIYKDQVDRYSRFKVDCEKYVPEIENFIQNNLAKFELSISEKISKSTLFFDVIFVPQGNIHYDLVLVCSKSFKKLLFANREISLRIEFLNGKIASIERKQNTIEENGQ